MGDTQPDGMTTDPENENYVDAAIAQEAEVMALPAYIQFFENAMASDMVYDMHVTCSDVWVRDHDLFGTFDHIVDALALAQHFMGTVLLTMNKNPDMTTPDLAPEMVNRYEIARMSFHALRGLVKASHLQHHADGSLSEPQMRFAHMLRKATQSGDFGALVDGLVPPMPRTSSENTDDGPPMGQYL